MAGREDDLRQEVYGDIWRRFDQIWESFRQDSERPQRWGAFESYLQVSIENALKKALRRGESRDLPLGDGDSLLKSRDAPTRDPLAALDARRLVERALVPLSWEQRECLLDMHERGKTSAETGRRLGLAPAAVDKARHLAKKQFRSELIRILGTDQQHIESDPVRTGIVRERCAAQHPCFLYKRDCRTARTPSEIARRLGIESPERVAQAVERAAIAVCEALAELGIRDGLEECLWEKRAPAVTERDHV